MTELLKIQGLKTQFFTSAGTVKAVDGVTYDVEEGETVAVVGESGCGKSVTALSIMRLVAEPAGRVVDGKILFQGNDLLQLEEEEMRKGRGNNIAMVFQEPMTSLNPVLSIGLQLKETVQQHLDVDDETALARAVELLGLVGMSDAERRLEQYHHHLSGGMRQRLAVARAMALHPSLIVLDEPVSALDVSIRAQIMNLLKDLQEK